MNSLVEDLRGMVYDVVWWWCEEGGAGMIITLGDSD